jgi:tripartite ATP-independent transporter DctP family solute receptor
MTITRRTVLKAGMSAMAGGVAMPYLARSGFATTPQYTMKMTYPDQPDHPLMQICHRFADNLAKKTDGAIEVEVYTTGQLGSQINMMTGLQTGIIDLCAHTSGFVQTIFPRFMVVDLPFLFSDVQRAEQMLDGPIGATLLNDFPSKGIYGFSYGHFGWRVVSTIDRPVPTPDAMRGLKVRVQPGAIYAAMFTTLGAMPVQIDLNEVYLALSQRVVDAIETPITSLEVNKYDEVVKVTSQTHHVYNVGVVLASKRKFDSLEAKYQNAIREASLEMSPDWRRTMAAATEQVTALVSTKGVQVVPVDRAAYRKALEPVYTQFRDTIGADLMDAVLKQAS